MSCEFAVNFFGFDAGETADILFTVQPPTGPGTELHRIDDAVISDDPAGGGAPDPDASFTFSFDDLGLDAFTAHPQQGYHVKLTIESDATPGAGKHKVFWIQPCESPTPTPTSPSPTPTTPSPTPTTPVADSHHPVADPHHPVADPHHPVADPHHPVAQPDDAVADNRVADSHHTSAHSDNPGADVERPVPFGPAPVRHSVTAGRRFPAAG